MIRFSDRLGALPGYPLAEIPSIKRRLTEATRSNVEVKRLYATVECFSSAPCGPTATPGILQIYAARIGLSRSVRNW